MLCQLLSEIDFNFNSSTNTPAGYDIQEFGEYGTNLITRLRARSF